MDGPEVFAFEEACAARFGGGHGIALANGSVALELALRAFGIGPGDEVVVSPRSFVASASCVMLVGRNPGLRRRRSRQREHHAEIDRAGPDRAHPRDHPRPSRRMARGHAGHHGPRRAKRGLICHRGLRAGARRRDRRRTASAASATPPLLLLPGQDHLDRRRRRLPEFKDEDGLELGLVVQGSRQELRQGRCDRPSLAMFRWLHDRVGTNWRLTGPQAAIGTHPAAEARRMARAARARTPPSGPRRSRTCPGFACPCLAPRHAPRASTSSISTLEAPTADAGHPSTEILRQATRRGIRAVFGFTARKSIAKRRLTTCRGPTARMRAG